MLFMLVIDKYWRISETVRRPIMITVIHVTSAATRQILTHYDRAGDESLAVDADWREQRARSDRDWHKFPRCFATCLQTKLQLFYVIADKLKPYA